MPFKIPGSNPFTSHKSVVSSPKTGGYEVKFLFKKHVGALFGNQKAAHALWERKRKGTEIAVDQFVATYGRDKAKELNLIHKNGDEQTRALAGSTVGRITAQKIEKATRKAHKDQVDEILRSIYDTEIRKLPDDSQEREINDLRKSINSLLDPAGGSAFTPAEIKLAANHRYKNGIQGYMSPEEVQRALSEIKAAQAPEAEQLKNAAALMTKLCKEFKPGPAGVNNFFRPRNDPDHQSHVRSLRAAFDEFDKEHFSGVAAAKLEAKMEEMFTNPETASLIPDRLCKLIAVQANTIRLEINHSSAIDLVSKFKQEFARHILQNVLMRHKQADRTAEMASGGMADPGFLQRTTFNKGYSAFMDAVIARGNSLLEETPKN